MELLLSPQGLDQIFPYFVLAYGVTMTFVLNQPKLIKLSQKVLPHYVHTQMNGHRTLGVICLVVGSVWSLQNLWAY